MFLRANTTLSTIVILFLFLFSISPDPLPSGRSFTLYSFFLNYPERTLVHHLSPHSSICPIRHLLWLFVNSGGWDCTVQRSSPHKCGQKSCCSAFNVVVAAFAFRYFYILIIFACAWSSSLSLDLPRRSPRLPKYLLDWYSLYSRSINSSDYIPPSFLYMILHSRPLLIIYSPSDVSISSNRAQDSIYQFGLLPPQLSFAIALLGIWHWGTKVEEPWLVYNFVLPFLPWIPSSSLQLKSYMRFIYFFEKKLYWDFFFFFGWESSYMGLWLLSNRATILKLANNPCNIWAHESLT